MLRLTAVGSEGIETGKMVHEHGTIDRSNHKEFTLKLYLLLFINESF